MSKLYKKFHCDTLNQINEQILSYIDQLRFYNDVFWNPIDVAKFAQANPLFVSWCRQNNLQIKTLSVTRGMHADCCGPHSDTPPCRYKLSWPVLNTEHTWNRWFKAKDSTQTEVNGLGGISYLNPNELEEIDRMQVDQPALIAVHVPHDVWFSADAQYPRIGLQCQLFREPETL